MIKSNYKKIAIGKSNISFSEPNGVITQTIPINLQFKPSRLFIKIESVTNDGSNRNCWVEYGQSSYYCHIGNNEYDTSKMSLKWIELNNSHAKVQISTYSELSFTRKYYIKEWVAIG